MFVCLGFGVRGLGPQKALGPEFNNVRATRTPSGLTQGPRTQDSLKPQGREEGSVIFFDTEG